MVAQDFGHLPFLFLFYAFTAIRQSSGDTITPVILGVIAMVVNSILSPIFISVFGFGVAGAAYATVIANIVIMPYGFVLMFKSKTGIKVRLKYAKLNTVQMARGNYLLEINNGKFSYFKKLVK